MSEQELHDLAMAAALLMTRLCDAGTPEAEAADVVSIWVSQQIRHAEVAL